MEPMDDRHRLLLLRDAPTMGGCKAPAVIATTLLLWATYTSAQHVVEVLPLTPNERTASGLFGTSVSISADGRIAVVGAPAVASPSAFVFHAREAKRWEEKQKLEPADESSSGFGICVAVSDAGSLALIGAHHDGRDGAAYVFQFDADSDMWIRQQKLIPADGNTGDEFGRAVALSGYGTTAIIGARFNDQSGEDSGAAYIFRDDDGAWRQTMKLLASDALSGDVFGRAVAIDSDGKTALVGAFVADEVAGAVYVFELNARSGTWVETQKLTPSDAEPGDGFGYTVVTTPDGNT